ncbi:MAG: hypothetical protein HOE90_09950 [Bacteriovoracaceae bacterium]|jgi:phosphate-selective porin OprO and OprP|nr:hypothetical protein [Bacteriovoracaceae bacterium]
MEKLLIIIALVFAAPSLLAKKKDKDAKKKGKTLKQKEGGKSPRPKLDLSSGLKFKDSDSEKEYKVSGRVMADWASFNQDLRRSEFISAAEVRSARLGISGKLYNNWEWALKLDYAGGSADIKSASASYSPIKGLKLSAGLLSENFGLDDNISTAKHPLMERSLQTGAFGGDDRLGVTINYASKRFMVELGGLDDTESQNGEVENRTRSYNFRASVAPLLAKSYGMHAGISAYEHIHRGGEGSQREAKFSSRPGVHVTDVKLVDTDDIKYTDYVQAGALEWGLSLHSFLFLAEYTLVQVTPLKNAAAGIRRRNFDGGFLLVSYALTGQSRKYDPKSGSFGGISIDKSSEMAGFGAMELAIRFDFIDLNDVDLKGGEEENYTFGFNWYLNNNFKLAANFIQVNSERSGARDRPRVVGIRAQFTY